MKRIYIYAGVAAILGLIGLKLILEKKSYTTVIIGFALVGTTGPYLYYAYYKIRHGYNGSREADALDQAEQELMKKGVDDDKK